MRFVKTTKDKSKPVAFIAEFYRNRKGLMLKLNYEDADLRDAWENEEPKDIQSVEAVMYSQGYAKLEEVSND